MANLKELSIPSLRDALNSWAIKSDNWLASETEKHNKLTKLRPIKDYRDSEVWGQSFADDLAYFERVADIKSVFSGLKNALLTQKVKDNGTQLKTIEVLTELADAEYWKWENIQSVAKQRLKFYEGLNYTFGNATFGAY